MDLAQFLTASRVLIVAGKGGVGKSTVAQTVASVAAEAGLSVLLVRIGALANHNSLNGEESQTAEQATGSATAMGLVKHLTLEPGDALAEYLSGRGLGIVTRQLSSLGIVDVVASAAPGIDDLLILGKIKQLARDGQQDLLIVDGPPAGQALSLLRAPMSLGRAVMAGPIRQQADDVRQMLADASTCRLMLVTTPEVTPVMELVDTAFDLEDELGVHLSPIVVNRFDQDTLPTSPDELRNACRSNAQRAALEYRLTRRDRQVAALEELRRRVPLQRVILPDTSATQHSGDLLRRSFVDEVNKLTGSGV
ncbi:MAG: ArsA family ATPase [Actinomycetota bacterium]